MANSYFQCKQFTIQQQHCAMKVTTDACLFGAWTASQIENKKLEIKHLLDVGTGTGLLSLMLAQKINAHIEAIEIDKDSALQAAENFAASPWQERLKVYHTSIQSFAQLPSHQFANLPINYFNFIISNPPFFENNLKSENDKRNLALHSSELSLVDLVQAVQKLLAVNGHFAILLPYNRTNFFIELMEKENFYLQTKTLVRQTPKHTFFRSMLLFGKNETLEIKEEIIFKDESNMYTPAFTALLQDYYLYL